MFNLSKVLKSEAKDNLELGLVGEKADYKKGGFKMAQKISVTCKPFENREKPFINGVHMLFAYRRT